MQAPDSQISDSGKSGKTARADLEVGSRATIRGSGTFLGRLRRAFWEGITAPAQLLTAQHSEYPISFWRSLFYFNFYRLAVAISFIFTAGYFGQSLFGSLDQGLFWRGSILYVLFGIFCHFTISARRPHFSLQLSLQVFGDIVFLVTLMYASGGITSGLGLLLLASLAAAGLISRGQLSLFYAALASIAVLLQQTVQVMQGHEDRTQYIQSGMLSIGYFATAWLANTLAKYALVSERLALQRGIELANLAQVNQLVIQDMQDGVLVVNENGVIRQHNSQVERFFGGLNRQRGDDVLLEQYAPALAQRLAHWRIRPQDPVEPLTISGTRLIGVRFVAVGDSRALGTVIFLEDLSRVQAQAQQLKLAALGRLTANIAHEIRNPLSSISHATELLQEEPEQTETQTRLLEIISENAQRLDRMVQDILKLNRRDRALRENIKLVNFLRKFIEEFCRNEKIATATFKLESHAQPVLFFDRSHLNQVMWNLCRNALRHCQRREGSIRLVTAGGTGKDAVRLDVIDDGPGVSPASRGHLFEPFFTTEAGGTGLGLYIAREICGANDATLDYVETTKGGHFRVICKSST
ncbi:MAG TPA: HAMP domain-containing sensor histidine kinase [Burkholderiales bacterium]|nr:HAMP domain-containing sensor histidine kinase [Burkholderiales bacterium]